MIVNDIKQLLGIPIEDDSFPELLILINGVVSALYQLGVGPKGFTVNSDTTWSEYLGEDYVNLYHDVKTYIYLKVKQAFDPPQTSFVLSSIENMAKELEWRINITAESLERGDE